MATSGLVLQDAAYSNLYGVRLNGLDATVDRSNFKSLSVVSATIQSVTAASINGSSVSVSLTNANANELLATNATTQFTSIPYTVDAIALSVPKRTSTDYTAFSQLFLTDTTNQITGNQSGNQCVLDAIAPSSSRVYSLSLESSSPNASLLSVASSATGTTAFLDPSITVAQIGLKSAASGTAQLVIDSFTGFESLFKFQIAGATEWSLKSNATDFIFSNEDFGGDYVVILDSGAHVTMDIIGDLVPTTNGIQLGSNNKRYNAFALHTTGGNTYTATVILTIPGGGLAVSTNMVFPVANNKIVTGAEIVLCSVSGFTGGARFVNGCPYVLVTGISAGTFNLNVYNLDTGTAIAAASTVTVTYWILP